MTAHSQQRTALHQLPDKAARLAGRWTVLAIAALLSAHSNSALAQTTGPPASSETTEQKVQQLTAAVARTQSQMDGYQKQLQECQRQLSELQEQLAAEKANPPAPSAPAGKPAVSASSNAPTGVSTSAIEDIRERQGVQESQIATHEQTKVETASKYPLKVSGLLLFNGYVNTRQVDVSADPTYALSGGGSTGLSLRQTVLGLDARGPHLFGATSHADVRVDFFANGSQSNYASGLLRLRTAHAGLKWQNTEAFFEQDRSF